MPAALLALCVCPVCHRLLDAPATLHCGHTVCTVHLRTVCPVPRCAPAVAPAPAPASSVAYHTVDAPSPPLPVPERPDVTVTKVLDLIARVQRDLQARRPNHSDPSIASSRRRPRSADEANHPRKRRRHDDGDGDLLSHLVASSVRQRSTRHDQPLLPPTPDDGPILAKFEKDLLAELTCEICFTLFYDPITTPCQHEITLILQQTFCTRCLHRALDHSPTCPLCRKELPGFVYFQEHPPNQLVLSLLLKAFPALYRERGETIEAEERDARLDTPIFVCQLSFPGMPTLLHFFEPRYRLMLRRCLESPNPSFGMVMPSKGGLSPHLDYGTMLEIRSVQMQPDGRSYVETWGTYRFRILEVGTLDGYMVGRIERIDDYPEDLPPATIEPGSPEVLSEGPAPEAGPTQEATRVQDASSQPEVIENALSVPSQETPRNSSPPIPLPNLPSDSALMEQCRSFLNQLQRGTAPWIVQRLSSTYGSMPTDVSSFSYWVASILPIDDHEKAKLLPIRSPRLRLLLLVHWIEQLNNNWYNVFYFTTVVTRGLLLIGILFFFCPIRLADLNRWFSNGCGIV